MAATVTRSPSAPKVELHRSSAFRGNSIFLHSPPSQYRTPLLCVLKTVSSDGGRLTGSSESYAPSLLRKPVVISQLDFNKDSSEEEHKEEGETEPDGSESSDQWADWEDRILEETVPLVGFVRTVIHSGKYKIGDKLSPEHQKIILERLLPYHPAYETKIGCGVDSVMVGFHTEFKGTRCLFIIRKDGEVIDFSYWKCIKGLIRKKYPLFADAFILRHFRRRRRNTKI